MNTWLDKKEYPFVSRYLNINGIRLHYIDEGLPDSEVILFVHGTPSWSFDFRNVIKKLKLNYRCVALDHIGFGLSDKPINYDYSSPNHSSTLFAFMKQINLKQVTLVVHDFGGPIGLHLAVNHPELIKRIVILNSWMWDCRKDPSYIKFSRYLKNPVVPFLYRYFNFSVEFILPRAFGSKKLVKKLHQQYKGPFLNYCEREGVVGFLKSLLNDQEWFGTIWQKRECLEGKPVLFIWGMKDPVIDSSYLQRFLIGFPWGRAIKLTNSGHFPQEEEPIAVATQIEAFIKKV